MATRRARKPGWKPTGDKLDAAHMLASNLYHARRDLDAARFEEIRARLDPDLIRATLRPFDDDATDVTLDACAEVVQHLERRSEVDVAEARALLEKLFRFWTIGWRP